MAYAQASAQKNWALVSYSFSNQHFSIRLFIICDAKKKFGEGHTLRKFPGSASGTCTSV
jgi:hypothetical protein